MRTRKEVHSPDSVKSIMVVLLTLAGLKLTQNRVTQRKTDTNIYFIGFLYGYPLQNDASAE